MRKEELKIQLRQVFGEQADEVYFNSESQMQLILELGRMGIDFEQSCVIAVKLAQMTEQTKEALKNLLRTIKEEIKDVDKAN